MSGFFWFSDAQWARVAPLLPTDTRGMTRFYDRRVLSGISHALRNGGHLTDSPREVYGSKKTVYNRSVRWAERGIWDWIFTDIQRAGGRRRLPRPAVHRFNLHQGSSLRCRRKRESSGRIITAATQATILGGLILFVPSMGSGSSMDSGTVDYGAELMQLVFEPCMMVSAWHSGMTTRIGAKEALKVLTERRTADIAHASDHIIPQVRGQSRNHRLRIYRAARIGGIDAALGLGR